MRSKSQKRMQEILDFVNDYAEFYNSSPSTREIAKALNIGNSTVYRYLKDMNDHGVIEYDGNEIITPFIRKMETGTIRVAVLGSVSCGVPLLEEEHIESYISLPEKLFGTGEFFILKANGDSMIEVGIGDGDLVVVRKEIKAQEGDIVVALLEDGSNTLKRIYFDKEHKKVILHPENKEMDDIIVDEVKIQGVAIKVMKNL